jgi:DNA-directed RNA polymerase III subunit RPC6
MLYELTPDVSVSGDIWIFNNELDEELVRVLTEQCARLLNERLEQALEKFPNDPFLRRTSSFISSTEVASLINDMGFANVKLTVQNIESILNILIYDGKIEKMTVAPTENGIKQNLYRSIKSILDASPVVRNPCGICPVFNDCHDEGVITPKTCIYLNKWLDF